MDKAMPSLSPVDGDEERNHPARHRAWIWIALWCGVFLALPGVLVGLLHQQKARQYAESLTTVAKRSAPAAPEWVQLRGDYRVQEAKLTGVAGNAVLLAPEPLEDTAEYFERTWQRTGFQVSKNLMSHDQEISAAILNASHASAGRFALITLSRSTHGTRIELAWSEKK
ncbi:MAG: hypothetical protein JNL62_17640 [Bryobacterales bacterium]|nr:hypothetical protein [Bryobacterales bacterium]